MTASDWPVEIDPVFGCWLWTSKLNDKGRPIIWRGQKPISAVRAVYEAEVRALKADEMPDHECKIILCVNPEHVEPVTRHENELRKSWRYRVARVTCKRGHDMRGAMVTSAGGRLCRTCHVAGVAARRPG